MNWIKFAIQYFAFCKKFHLSKGCIWRKQVIFFPPIFTGYILFPAISSFLSNTIPNTMFLPTSSFTGQILFWKLFETGQHNFQDVVPKIIISSFERFTHHEDLKIGNIASRFSVWKLENGIKWQLAIRPNTFLFSKMQLVFQKLVYKCQELVLKNGTNIQSDNNFFRMTRGPFYLKKRTCLMMGQWLLPGTCRRKFLEHVQNKGKLSTPSLAITN